MQSCSIYGLTRHAAMSCITLLPLKRVILSLRLYGSWMRLENSYAVSR